MNHGGDLKGKGIEKRRAVIVIGRAEAERGREGRDEEGRLLDGVGLRRRKGAEVVDNLEGEMSRRRNGGQGRGGGYVLGIGAGYKFVRREGEVSWSSAVTGLLNILLHRAGPTSKTQGDAVEAAV